MKFVRILLGMLAALIASGAIWLTINCRDMLPVLAAVPEDAVRQAEALVADLCAGDYAAAEKRLYGTPSLEADRVPADIGSKLIWDAYVASLDYEMLGQPYATDTGIAQDVKIISLEIPSVTENLGQRAKTLLQQGVDEAQSVDEIYDAENKYKEPFVAEVMEEATRQALEEDTRYTYRILSLQLVYRDDQWWVVADQALLDVFSGVAD